MTSVQLADALVAELPEAEASTAFGQRTVRVPVSQWRAAALTARDVLGCAMFDWLGAQDAGRPGPRPGPETRYTVTLHVLRPRPWCGLLVSTELTEQDGPARLPSIAEVWAGAAWHEREAAEMFGIELDGHPDPRRLLLPDSFAGHPLRKDFVLAARVVRPWPGSLEPGEGGVGAAPSRRRIAPPGVPGPEWGPRRDEEGRPQ